MGSSTQTTQKRLQRLGVSIKKEPTEEIQLPDIRLITQEERNSLDAMVKEACAKILGPDEPKIHRDQ
jgi:hypothetical protein